MPDLKCAICGKPACGVSCSPLGAISSAYCVECLQSPRESWPVLVGCLMGCERNQVAEWVQPIIDATVAFYGKTEDDLWGDVERSWTEYEAYMRKETDV